MAFVTTLFAGTAVCNRGHADPFFLFFGQKVSNSLPLGQPFGNSIRFNGD
jgi:hypothetical protein